MKRITALALGALILAACLASAAAAGTGTQQRPVAFLETVVTALVANDYDTAWQSLHPRHQAVADEAEYVSCEQLSPIPGRLESLTPIRSRHKAVAVAGLARRVRGVVVTFRLRLADPASGMTTALTLTAATVRVGDRWAWMLPRARYDVYERDACLPL